MSEKCTTDCVCAACQHPNGRDGMVALIKRRVFQEGNMQVVPVIPDGPDDITFAYTIGMKHAFNLPELFVALKHIDPMALGDRLMQVAKQYAKHPEFFERDIVPDVLRVTNPDKKAPGDPDTLGVPVACLKLANVEDARNEMGVAKSVYGVGVNFDVRQIVLSDRNGKFHWDAGCNTGFHASQPLLKSVVLPPGVVIGVTGSAAANAASK